MERGNARSLRSAAAAGAGGERDRPRRAVAGFLFALLIASAASAVNFFVTNTSDDGPGSLRQAIIDANASVPCATEVCVLVFNITEPVPATGWFTIRPHTPYPEISVNYLTIDGASQTAFSGDTNPLGPEIEISGENMTGTAPMLTMRHGCRTALSNLAIDNAPGAALHLGDYVPAYDPKTCSFTTLVTPAYEYRNVAEIGHNYIGTDPTGRAAAPNFRGIAGDGADGFDIHDNIVSGNVASGIHLTDPSHTGIHDNFIGIAADGEPLGNGASGIYASASGSLYAQLLRIDRNVIAFNKHWAIDLGLPGNIEFASNRIYGNQLTAIGAFNTLGVSDQVFIDGAVFDPTTGMTAVHGHFVNRGFEPLQSGTVTLFRSFGLGLAGYGEAESPIGSAPVTQSGAWDFRYPGDLTGRYVTAIVTTSTIRTGGFTYDTYVQSYGLSAAVIVTR